MSKGSRRRYSDAQNDAFLDARGGVQDIVDCEPGFGTVKADIGVDSIDSDCESVS